ncbi:MAG: UDP-N-acetylmuramoyl-L-alanine--D-glutamate ligase [Desulfobacterales bacterium]
MEVQGKHITVAGLGTTGQALARFLHRRGAHVTVTDSAPEADLGEAPAKLRELGVGLELGGHGQGVFESADMIVLSPGVPHTIEPVERARKSGVRVIGEIELAGRFISAPVVAVTGTNGKSTVTRLIGQMLDQSGLTVFVGGNLGTPLISHADEDRQAEVVVAEISSFQLDTVETFRPKVAVLLNIAADHLDRYPSLYAYGAAKTRLFENQTGTDTAVINAADALIMELARDIRARKCLFNTNADAECCARLEENGINASPVGSGPVRVSYDDIPMVGRHNYENVAAAVLAAIAAGADPDGVGAGIRSFRPDPHRLEWVAQIRGVNYYDDSKATNVDAVCRAIEAVRPPVVLILGGRDKGGGYGGLADSIRRHVKAMVLLGEAADAIEGELGGMVQTRRADSMAGAVSLAADLADAGDTVLLSPACSSFDMYESYAGRGRDFQRAVHNLENRKNG